MQAIHYMQDKSGHVFTTTNPEWHKDCANLTKTAGKTARREYCKDELRKLLQPGQTVYTILRHCSVSGMSRRISLVVSIGGGMRDITQLSADALDDKLSDKGGIIVGGCGMDMGFHLVYSLGSVLWPKGTDEPHGTRNGQPDTAGGYALKHEWL